MADTRGIPLAPLTGVLDLRSSPDALAQGAMRMRQNLQTVGKGKLRRGSGWRKFLSNSTYNNSDFHDQLLTFTTGGIRQPPTLLYRAESSRKVRSLIVATQGKIAQLNQHSGNYKILGSGYGGTQGTSAALPRFHAASVGDLVAFTNDFDRPKYIFLEEAGSPVHEFTDLPVIGLSRARVIWSWHNCLFLANVEMDSQRYANRLLWSNFQDGTSFDPAKANSITGRKDLFSGEEILAGRPSGNSFLIYTNKAIWEMTVIGGDQSFGFRRVYNAEDNELSGTLAYPNTLVNTKAGHLYAAEDGIYRYTQYASQPERLEWLHLSTPILYDNIDKANCQVHVAGQYGDEVLFSFAKVGDPNNCPSVTLRVNLAYGVCDVVDHGFTAFENYESFDAPTIRDFIVENRICTLAGLASAGYPYVNEGLPRPLPAAVAAFEPQSFYTSTSQTIDGLVVEDWTRPNADSDSLCTLLAGERLDDICLKCKGATLFVAACSIDWCLKQLGDVFYRERCVNPTAVGTTDSTGYSSAVGSYLLDGITSILRPGPGFADRADIQCDRLEIDYLAASQTIPSLMSLRIGISMQPADSNVGECRIVWHQHSSQPLRCLTSKTMAQHLADATQPSLPAEWNFLRRGPVLHFEWTLTGVGGDALFSKFEADMKKVERR